MIETELKFQVPDASWRAVDAAVGAGSSRRTRLQAIYFDTPDRRLADAGLALRLRKEGRQWVQTLKAAGPDAMQRLEHDVPLAAATAGLARPPQPPQVDPRRHDGTPVGELLALALAPGGDGGPAPALAGVCRTDIWRRARTLRSARGSVELAFDRGEIVAGDRRWPVCELEIELVSGRPVAVIDVARRWVRRHGLWLDVRSKAERGDRLARGALAGPVVKAGTVRLAPALSSEAALQLVVANCLQQILPNASEVADGRYGDEHVHQLRVGLRRLRSALRFFAGWTALVDSGWDERLAVLFRQLSVVRDRDALAASLLPALREAGAPLFELPAAPPGPTPTESLRAREATLLLLDLLARQLDAGEPPAPQTGVVPLPLAEAVTERLQRWHRRVLRTAKRYASIDDAERHRLRRRAKRLRYAAEFAASLFEPKDVARYLARLEPVQDCLGRYNDLCVGLATYRGTVGDDPRAWFAIGWLTARREVLLAEGAAALERFGRGKPFWRGR